MDLEDFIISNNILPLGSVIFVIFCASRKGWGWENFIKEANTGSGLKFPTFIRNYMLWVSCYNDDTGREKHSNIACVA